LRVRAVPGSLQRGCRPAADSGSAPLRTPRTDPVIAMKPRTIVILVLAGMTAVFLLVGLAGFFLAY